MIDINPALAIDGWMSAHELLWLARKAERHQVIAEIGSYLGRSTRALADHTPGIVYAIDDWYGPRDVDWLTQTDRELTFTKFLANTRVVAEKVRIVNTNHAVASIPERPDFVFIDGDHAYASVVWDIERWLLRVVPGGIISGHDVCRPDVAKAVRRVLGAYEVVPDTTIWYVEV